MMSKVRYHCALWTALGACRPRFRALGHLQPRLARGGIGRIVHDLGSTVGCRSHEGHRQHKDPGERSGAAMARPQPMPAKSRSIHVIWNTGDRRRGIDAFLTTGLGTAVYEGN